MLLRALVALLLAAVGGGAKAPSVPPILFAADDAPALSGELYRLDANGRVVDLSKSAFRDEQPVVAPNGRRVAFISVRDEAAGIYVVGIDGRGLQRLDPPPHRIASSADSVQLVWSPDSRRLAVVSGDLTSRLTIMQPGRAPIVVTRAPFVYAPIWSPDSRLVAVQADAGEGQVRQLRVFTSAGKPAWRVPYYGDAPSWSHSGLLATVLATKARAWVSVHDERGRLLQQFAGRTAAWSPDGRRLASVAGGVVDVRTAGGKLFLRKPFRGLANHRVVLRWIDDRRLLVSFYPRLRGLDTGTGKEFPGSIRWLAEPRSPDGRFVADTAKSGTRFAVRVSALPQGLPHVYGYVPGCFDDGSFTAAITALQFVPHRASLIYESACAEPFSALYGVNPDGSGLTRLTQRQEDEHAPAASPDGSQLAFTRFDAVGQSCKGCPGSLVVAAADGSSPRVLVTPQESTGAYAESGASWSPDGTRILYTEWNFSIPAKLFVVPAAGGPPVNLHIDGGDAAWGPTRIAWIDSFHSPATVWTANPDGSGQQQVATGTGTEELLGPAWSSDGRLAFVEGRSTVGIVSGGSVSKVALPFLAVGSVRWSPDGTRFVVAARAAGTAVPDIYTVRTDGTDVRRLTTDLDASSPDWR